MNEIVLSMFGHHVCVHKFTIRASISFAFSALTCALHAQSAVSKDHCFYCGLTCIG